MTDDLLVERLLMAPHADFYRPSKWFELMTDAAAEIGRLRADLESGMERFYSQMAELGNAKAEIERLRAEAEQQELAIPRGRRGHQQLARQVRS